MLKYSKYARTRSFFLTEEDVAEGYISQANRVLAGDIHLPGDKDDKKAELEKARKILSNLRGRRA